MPSFRRRVTRLAFSTVSRVSPRLAGGLAFRLFCLTPSKQPRATKGKEALRRGQDMLTAAGVHSMPIDAGGFTIMTHRLKHPGARAQRILVVHGWGSRSEFLAQLALDISATGAEVVMLDLPGHGGSSGRSLHLRRAAQAIAATSCHFGPFDGVVAHSFGGASVMAAAGGVFAGVTPPQFGRIALIGAPTEIESLFSHVARELRLSPAAAAEMVRHAEVLGGQPLSALDTVPIARALGVPLLVMHAEDDKEVGAHHARRYEGVAPELEVRWANGFGHRRIVSAPSVTADISRFLTAQRSLAA